MAPKRKQKPALTLLNLDSSCLGEYAKQQIRKAFNANHNRASNPTPHVERPARNESIPAYAGPKFTAPVCINIYSTRKRKTDIDNISGKAVLDGCVKSGIFKDDSPEFVEAYQVHRPEIGKEEKTVIIITGE
jgi:Holliday junction resolvase RusA-like endonuclease